MKVTLNKVFPLQSGKDAAWSQLQDIEAVASCMPGAEITEKVDDHNYKGKVKLKVGPMNVAFNGTIEVQSVDEGERKLHLIAAGKDAKGTSSASMDLTAVIQDIQNSDSGQSDLVGDADVTVNGKLANFGGRMMAQIADQILQQFADNFNSRLPAETTASEGMNESATAADSRPEAASENHTPPPASNDINIFKFGWSVLLGFFKSFFKSSK